MQEININTSKETMFKQQQAEIQSRITDTDKRFKQAVVENKIMMERVRKENSEFQRISDEFEKINRTGR